MIANPLGRLGFCNFGFSGCSTYVRRLGFCKYESHSKYGVIIKEAHVTVGFMGELAD